VRKKEFTARPNTDSWSSLDLAGGQYIRTGTEAPRLVRLAGSKSVVCVKVVWWVVG